jgi:DNA helicase-2/ATP-dependent DNA helicase PcrA
MTPSPQQQTILDEVLNGTGSIVVQARAGSGKTTLLRMIAEVTPPTELVVAIAFNKQNAITFAERFPKHVQSSTFHSRALNALGRSLPRRPRVDGEKVFKLLKDNLSSRDMDKYFKYVLRLIGYAKNAGLGTDLMLDTPNSWYSLIDHFSLILDSNGTEDEAIEIASDILRRSNEDLTSIDFDDMLYLSVLRKVTFDKANKLLLDEAQDTNAVQRQLVHWMLAPNGNGRLIAVGDERQSIYGFRGADSDALELIQQEFNCKVLPLSVSYRCAQSVVKEAQKTEPDILPHEDAPVGSVEKLPTYDLDNFDSNDCILCRVTAPLVSLAFGFIKRNVGVRILGREIGAGLVTLVKKLNAENVDDLEPKLRRWADREIGKALARGHESAAAAIEDKQSCLFVFIDQLPETDRTTSSLIRRIESLFSDNNKGLLTLCSVHKAKGLEWDRVFILDRDKYMPSKWAKQEWQLKQEHNLVYVAVTRAKLDLRFIRSATWKDVKLSESEIEELKRKEILESL